ncbi:alpha-beta hydrolase superfamily lysophospholipase [Clostridiales Family XIII bacterium PM5-7]
MYDNFAFESRNKAVTGYDFHCTHPTQVMCVLHGIGEHAGRYKRMAEKLEQEGIAMVSMDLRGHGISTGVRGDAAPRDEVLADVDALIESAQKLYPGLPITLYGHSMGGNICLDYRNRGEKNYIPKKYIVSAPWIELVRTVPKAQYVFLKSAAKVLPKLTISSGCEEADLGNLEYVRPYKSNPLVHDKISIRCAVDGFDIGEKLAKGLLENNHGADGKPLLLMHGDADKVCNVEGARKVAALHREEPNFEYVEWPGFYHEIHNGGPDATGNEVIEKIIKFILG